MGTANLVGDSALSTTGAHREGWVLSLWLLCSSVHQALPTDSWQLRDQAAIHNLTLPEVQVLCSMGIMQQVRTYLWGPPLAPACHQGQEPTSLPQLGAFHKLAFLVQSRLRRLLTLGRRNPSITGIQILSLHFLIELISVETMGRKLIWKWSVPPLGTWSGSLDPARQFYNSPAWTHYPQSGSFGVKQHLWSIQSI